MRIDWEHETFESGLETWTTEFRGMVVEIRRLPEESDASRPWLSTKITAGPGSPVLHDAYEEISESDAMTAALKWINGYWDVLEDGPNAQYEVVDLEGLEPDPSVRRMSAEDLEALENMDFTEE